ncbi:kinase-like domain-containing protein, partial [Chytriomyces sp. MP71]
WLYLDQAPTPHLLPLLGTNLTTRPSFLVCPYMKNGNLLAYTRAHPGHSLRLLLETSRGMAHLHATGVLHGALRASNVLVGDDGHALLADVGLAQYRGECATDGVARAGWRRWAAPEILRGGEYLCCAMRPQSDTYSFAMMMYEILTGDIPFINRLHDPDDPEGGFDLEMEEAEVTRLVLHEAIRPLKPSHCPDKFWQLVEACWAQDALQRPTFA